MNDTFSAGLWTISVIAAYLVGSIPFGYLIARGVKGIDIRTVGSGNLGATNVGQNPGVSILPSGPDARRAQRVLADVRLPLDFEPARRAATRGSTGLDRAGGDLGSYVSSVSQVSRRERNRDQSGRGAGARSGLVCRRRLGFWGSTAGDSLRLFIGAGGFSGLRGGALRARFRSFESPATGDDAVHRRRRGLADLPASLEHRLGSGRVPRTGSTSAVDARNPTVRLIPAAAST